MNRPLNLLHLANHHSTNIGNGALIYGLERVLREDLGVPLQFSPEPWDDYTLTGTRRFDAGFVERVNKEHDAWLVGAAVAMNAWPDFPNSGFRVDLPLEQWDKLKKPVILYGVSYRVWPEQPYPFPRQFRDAMRRILDNPNMLFSVRNDGTRAWLTRLLGFDSERIEVAPDPAMYVPIEDCPHPELVPGKLNIALSLNNEDDVHRFGGPSREAVWKALSPFASDRTLASWWRRIPGWDARRSNCLKNIAAALDRVAKDRDINLILLPHTFDDFKISHEFLSYCSRRLAYQLTVATGINRVAHAPRFYDLYSKVDVALSMRVHSMSPSIGLGTPTVALCSQARMVDYMADMGLQEYALDVFSPDLAERLPSLVARIADRREEARREVAAAVARARARTAAYHRKVGKLLAVPESALKAPTGKS